MRLGMILLVAVQVMATPAAGSRSRFRARRRDREAQAKVRPTTHHPSADGRSVLGKNRRKGILEAPWQDVKAWRPFLPSIAPRLTLAVNEDLRVPATLLLQLDSEQAGMSTFRADLLQRGKAAMGANSTICTAGADQMEDRVGHDPMRPLRRNPEARWWWSRNGSRAAHAASRRSKGRGRSGVALSSDGMPS